jgi:hypothetical protein
VLGPLEKWLEQFVNTRVRSIVDSRERLYMSVAVCCDRLGVKKGLAHMMQRGSDIGPVNESTQ